MAISDDPKLLRDMLDNSTLASLRFVHLPKIDQSGIEGKYDALFRDFRTLLGAAGMCMYMCMYMCMSMCMCMAF